MKTIKSILGIGLVAVLTACGGSQQETALEEAVKIPALENYEKTTGGPQILFSEYEHDFGSVSKENKLTHTFYYVNSGDAPLVITNAKGSCGCTIPYYETDPILPGQQNKIEVEIDPSNKLSGQVFQVTVRVESNAKDSMIKLNLKGTPQDEK